MALARLQALLTCLPCPEHKINSYPDEKQALLACNDTRPAVQVAEDVVETIMHTKLMGSALRMQLESIVGTYGWTDRLAKWILEKLTQALQGAHEKLGPVVRDAYHKAWDVARSIEGFVIEHPVMCTVIALGVLCIIAPWVIEALGFAELGPIEGMFISVLMRCIHGDLEMQLY